MTVHGCVKNGVVVFNNGTTLPEGTPVEVTHLRRAAESASALIAAMEAEPHPSMEDIAELRGAIAGGKRPAAAIDPLAQDTSK